MRRKDKAKNLRRRHKLWSALTSMSAFAGINRGVVSDLEAFLAVFGTLKDLRKVTQKLLRNGSAPANGTACMNLMLATQPAVVSPARTVRVAHPELLPILSLSQPIPPPSQDQTQCTLLSDETLSSLRGCCLVRAVEFLADSTGITKTKAIELLLRRGMLAEPPPPDWIRAIEAGAVLEARLTTARQRYHAAVSLGHIDAAEGAWALIEDLKPVLSWVKIPDRFERDFLLCRLLESPERSSLWLETFSQNYHPLFRVRVPASCRLLI